jgi:hypothetical protein
MQLSVIHELSDLAEFVKEKFFSWRHEELNIGVSPSVLFQAHIWKVDGAPHAFLSMKWTFMDNSRKDAYSDIWEVPLNNITMELIKHQVACIAKQCFSVTTAVVLNLPKKKV